MSFTAGIGENSSCYDAKSGSRFANRASFLRETGISFHPEYPSATAAQAVRPVYLAPADAYQRETDQIGGSP